MTMEALPIEVLTHILQYLSPIDRLRSEQVCKKWRDASRHTWGDVQILCILQLNINNNYSRFRNRSKFYELVEKEENRLFIGTDSPKIIRCLVSRVGCFIKELIITYAYSENYRDILSIVSSYCHNLKIFETGLIFRSHDKKSLKRLFECNKELNSIMFHRSFDVIEAIIPLRNWKSLRFCGYDQINYDKIVSFIEHSEALEEFEMVGYTKRIVEALLKRHNLKSLYFKANSKVSLDMIFDVPLLNRLTNLDVFDRELNSNMLSNMLQHCCQLKRLNIADVSDGDPVKLFETILALPVLETLTLCYDSITDDMLIHLIKVRNLCLFDNRRHMIMNNGILQMIKKSEVLEKLHIQYTAVTPEMFKQLVGEMNDRPKYLEVIVPYKIFNEVFEICAGSKIRVVRDMWCFKN